MRAARVRETNLFFFGLNIYGLGAYVCVCGRWEWVVVVVVVVYVCVCMEGEEDCLINSN